MLKYSTIGLIKGKENKEIKRKYINLRNNPENGMELLLGKKTKIILYSAVLFLDLENES